MEGKIGIFGMSDAEISANSEGLEYNRGFGINASCRMRRVERIEIVAQLMRQLHMDREDIISAAELAIAPEGFLPPWIARAKSMTVFGPNDGRKVEDGDA